MTDSPLRGVRVLIPRAPGRGEALAARIEAAGGSAIVAPLISRADAEGPDLDALAAAVRELHAGEYGWVAITSVNAVSALVTAAELGRSAPDRALEGPSSGHVPEVAGGTGVFGGAQVHGLGTGADARGLSGLSGLSEWPVRWAVVGPATARALRRAGVEPELVAAENSAVGMLAEWPDAQAPTPSPGSGSTSSPGPSRGAGSDVSPGPDSGSTLGSDPSTSPGTRVLLPLGDLAEPTLERGLAERGYTPVRITAYRTVSHPAPPEVVADWAAGRIHLVVLTSGSVAREVARQLGPRPDVLAVAIGQPTRRAAEGTGQRVAAVATGATDDALFSAIIDAAAVLPTILPTTPPEDQ